MEISLEKGEALGDALKTLLEDIQGRLAFFARHRDELARIRLLEKAFEVTPAPAFIADPEGRIEWANPAYFSLVGENAESLFQTIHPYLDRRDKSRTNSEMWGRLRKGLSASGEFLHRRREGTEFLAEIRISPILDEDKALVSLVAIETDITRERRKEKELRLLAFHDPLTGLPNRAALEREFEGYLAVARRYRRVLVLLFFDLDGFKEVNDSLGHEAGDQLLAELAIRVESELRGGDRLFRLGGDEFLVILNNAGTRTEVEQLARRLLEVIHQPFDLRDQEVGIGASIGIALYPENAASQQDLLRMADMAMYRAKNRGKNRIEFYDGEEKSDSPAGHNPGG
jgi:diguanylate cyclase (GGDEF)-like protein/PAS domain S-box-containing protein